MVLSIQAKEKNNVTVRMRAMTCGYLHANAAPFMEGLKGRIALPIPSYLIEHPKGRVLFDTGLHPQLRESPEDRLGGLAKAFEVEYAQGEDIKARLESINVDPGSINFIVNSHLHFDHAGGNEMVPNANLVIQRPEWEAGSEPDSQRKNGFNPRDYDLGHSVILADGEHDIFGDGTLTCIPTYGHTPGHQSLRVRLDRGDVVLTGDACYFKETLETLKLPTFSYDFEMQRKSLLRLRKLQNSGARIFYGHDLEFWKNIPQAPLEIS